MSVLGTSASRRSCGSRRSRRLRALGAKDARTFAREILGMTQEEFSGAFKGSAMKRAKLRGLKRNAPVVLGSVGDEHDVDVLTRALDDPEPLVRESVSRERVPEAAYSSRSASVG